MTSIFLLGAEFVAGFIIPEFFIIFIINLVILSFQLYKINKELEKEQKLYEDLYKYSNSYSYYDETLYDNNDTNIYSDVNTKLQQLPEYKEVNKKVEEVGAIAIENINKKYGINNLSKEEFRKLLTEEIIKLYYEDRLKNKNK